MMLFSVLQRRGLIVANQLQRCVVSLQTRSFDRFRRPVGELEMFHRNCDRMYSIVSLWCYFMEDGKEDFHDDDDDVDMNAVRRHFREFLRTWWKIYRITFYFFVGGSLRVVGRRQKME